MKNNILPAIRLTLVCMVFFCGIYTFSIWLIAQTTQHQGKGETITHQGKKYYTNIGQNFTQNKYFWSRPSAVSYNAAGSGGSNKSCSNPDYLKEVQARIDTFLLKNPTIQKEDIPSDIVTASGSGLDPHISVQAAKIQVNRIAKVRNISEKKVHEIIENHIEEPLLGIGGTEKINVLKLNLALDKI
ncbi:potassium-transporting ATPase subunit C [bacterium 336/3]|nr:potassium-transporting ATPase subunit C [bacterium 336/3]